MTNKFYQQFRLGVLGGGQLGRMLIQSGIDLNIEFNVLDPDANAPCSQISHFTCGKLTDFDTVMAFGEKCDLITIEIENVNIDALKELVKKGKKVFPQPEVIELIQDKRVQKQFYKEHGIPTAEFILTENRSDVLKYASAFVPSAHKLGKGGYDGQGVQIIRSTDDLHKAFDAPGVLEKLIDFEKEIAVIVSRNERGEVRVFPSVEMVFHPEANLVEYLLSPAQIDDALENRAAEIATSIIEKLKMVGILAVEMFLTKDHKLLVNEIAPRPHNSGHHTIEANATSQYQQHLRAILGLAPGNTEAILPAAMVNLLGEEGHTGVANYSGLEEVLAITGTHVHLYGKKMTKPFRKMGHVTIVDRDVDSLKKKIDFVKKTLKVTT
ncbi:MAG: 5-(carboxyamino)imidazole ribonucleotide synthase [Bacteroidota bacterium]